MTRPFRMARLLALAAALLAAPALVPPSAAAQEAAPAVAQPARPAAAAEAATAAPARPDNGLPARQGPPRTLRAYGHVFVAFALAWLLLFGYVVHVARKFGRVERELEALRAGRA